LFVTNLSPKLKPLGAHFFLNITLPGGKRRADKSDLCTPQGEENGQAHGKATPFVKSRERRADKATACPKVGYGILIKSSSASSAFFQKKADKAFS